MSFISKTSIANTSKYVYVGNIYVDTTSNSKECNNHWSCKRKD